jgi:hypothetical protein
LLVHGTHASVGGFVSTMHTASSGGQRFPSIISLELSRRSLPFRVVRGAYWGATCYQQCFLFFSFLLFSLLPLKIVLAIQNFRVILLFIKISTLVFLLLISNLYYWSFWKILICFQFHHSILFVICYFFSNLVLILLFFFCPFVKFFFSISPFNKIFILILYFSFLFQFWSLLF